MHTDADLIQKIHHSKLKKGSWAHVQDIFKSFKWFCVLAIVVLESCLVLSLPNK